ncbi:hypothetical protein TNCV_4072341 [Trichonephila clavipes]|uniref:Uncharacterized protein n=1 Tax=Trichonephila clavipes TaxID=2585209 RepID=A0A8X6W976_TRICX|nr:hypothetical protein TNCV_4072341 [Trichonephila clavipes]
MGKYLTEDKFKKGYSQFLSRLEQLSEFRAEIESLKKGKGVSETNGDTNLSPPPESRHGAKELGNILQYPAPVVSAETTHKTFGPTDLTSAYFVCTAPRSGV